MKAIGEGDAAKRFTDHIHVFTLLSPWQLYRQLREQGENVKAIGEGDAAKRFTDHIHVFTLLSPWQLYRQLREQGET